MVSAVWCPGWLLYHRFVQCLGWFISHRFDHNLNQGSVKMKDQCNLKITGYVLTDLDGRHDGTETIWLVRGHIISEFGW